MYNEKKVTSKSLDFIKENILSISELTRTPRLSEILSNYAGTVSDEVYIIKNNKVKDAAGVLVDYERFLHLLKIEEFFDELVDDYMFEVALARKDELLQDKPVSLEEVVEDDDFDYNDLIKKLNTFELEEE